MKVIRIFSAALLGATASFVLLWRRYGAEARAT